MIYEITIDNIILIGKCNVLPLNLKMKKIEPDLYATEILK